jgi:DNA-directed RNA polymerase specialized sigma24 family protein
VDIPENHLHIIDAIVWKYAKKWGLPFSDSDYGPHPEIIIGDDDFQDEPLEVSEDNLSELLGARRSIKIENVIGINGIGENERLGKPQRTWYTIAAEDIKQVAYETYLKAKARGVEFTKSYLNIIIPGAIIDELRKKSQHRPEPNEKKQPVKWIPGRKKAAPLTPEQRQFELELQARFIAEKGVTLCPPGPGLEEWPHVSYPVEWFITYYNSYGERVTECYMGEETDPPENAPIILIEYQDDVDSDNEDEILGGKLLREIQAGSELALTEDGIRYKRIPDIISQIDGRERMEQFPPQLREVIGWRYIDLTYQEIAKEKGLSIRQVRYQVEKFILDAR